MRRLLWLGLVGILFAGLGAGCGSEDRPFTLPDHVERLDAIFEDASVRADEINTEFRDANAEAETDEEHMDAFRGLFDDQANAFEDLVDDLNGLHVIPLLEDEHNDLVQSVADVAEILRDFSRRAKESESLDDMRELFAELEEPEYDEAVDRVGKACGVFQALATDNGIDIDLRCAFASVGHEHAD